MSGVICFHSVFSAHYPHFFLCPSCSCTFLTFNLYSAIIRTFLPPHPQTFSLPISFSLETSRLDIVYSVKTLPDKYGVRVCSLFCDFSQNITDVFMYCNCRLLCVYLSWFLKSLRSGVSVVSSAMSVSPSTDPFRW